MYAPLYIEKSKDGTLEKIAKELMARLEKCDICPHVCGVNRLAGQKGFCKAKAEVEISSFGPHFGEESVLVGRNGSGTIFFTHCNMRCVFCQNFTISQLGEGMKISIEELADIMLRLQNMGCHNINLVTPTHYAPQIVSAINIAAKNGLKIPIVYNCGGYERKEIITLLDGIIDIYMPDFKYGDDENARVYSGVNNYTLYAKESLIEMQRQVGDLIVDEYGIAVKGLIIRHLVLPNDIAKSEEVLRFIARNVSPKAYVNIMAQYYPTYQAHKYPEIARRITIEEYRKVLKIAKEIGPEFRLAD
ncbi:MAG: radical SAM protein [Fervidobacterium sp.]|jgi:putative pyruvate formate lyase activating enzyme|uniref:Putative pyruvate formate lyase activating enzyme n=1 Tax=Fervidobacterium gondwanense DSM 13020 TaxID=1121883 RepID=A0A1M7RRM0_FERGO|nr:radical SAM protein [Fervidobacterium gondwanense]UXF00335.1 radical SAM protein [Fervidobacterium riparium]SHN48904.1 putative pyruvate formate lyase activating enzyme [Fervidobacterium gondwanense DSM 13020]